MCGRFTKTRGDRRELAAMLDVPESELGDYSPQPPIEDPAADRKRKHCRHRKRP